MRIYTPTVVPAVPTANPATSKDIQGATQTVYQPCRKTVQAMVKIKLSPFKENSYTLLIMMAMSDKYTSVYAADGND